MALITLPTEVPAELIDLPTKVPAELWPMVIDLLRGKLPENKFEAVRVLYHVAGYVLGKFDPNHPPVIADVAPSRAHVAELLEAEFVTPHAPGAPVTMALPWLAILSVLIELALEFLRRR